jgi:hypothetical protein
MASDRDPILPSDAADGVPHACRTTQGTWLRGDTCTIQIGDSESVAAAPSAAASLTRRPTQRLSSLRRYEALLIPLPPARSASYYTTYERAGYNRSPRQALRRHVASLSGMRRTQYDGWRETYTPTRRRLAIKEKNDARMETTERCDDADARMRPHSACGDSARGGATRASALPRARRWGTRPRPYPRDRAHTGQGWDDLRGGHRYDAQ